MEVGGQRHAPATLPPGKMRYTLYRRLGGPQGRFGRVRKISPLTGFRSPERPARSESLYRLSYSGPQMPLISQQKVRYTVSHKGICGTGQLKCDGTHAETRFRLSAKQTSPFKSAGGRQFSRLLAAEMCASAVVMLDTPCSEVV